MSEDKIAILLPFKDHYTNSNAGSASIWVKDFNKKSLDYKLSYSIDHIHSYKFPLAKSTILTIHSFKHKLYNKYIGRDDDKNIEFKSKKYNFKLLE